MTWGASGSFLGLCFLALLLLLCSKSEAKLEGLGKHQLQEFELQSSELAKLPWVGGSFESRSSQAGFVRKLVADNSPILRSPDWSREEWMKETVRKSRTRAEQIAASSPVVSLVFGSREYYLTLEVGTPAQETLLIVDTGSELTWVECKPCNTCLSNLTFDPTKSTSYSVVSCSDAVCTNLTGADRGCDTSVQECQYQIVYGQGTTTVGDVATDVVATHPVCDGVSKGAAHQKFVMGCGGFTQPGRELGASGLIGLDRGPLSFVSQLDAKKFSYCLPDRFAQNASQGYIYFGELPEQVNTSTGLEWKSTPILTNPFLSEDYYFLGVTGLSVGGKPVDIPQSAWSIDNVTGSGGVLLDSGTTIQFLRTDVYGPLRTALEAQTEGLTLNSSAEAESGIGPCYHVPDPSRLLSTVPNMTIHLQGGVNWELPIGNYLWPYSPEHAVYCYAFLSWSRSFSIFGNLFQQNFVIEHDLTRSMFSISGPTDCSLQAD